MIKIQTTGLENYSASGTGRVKVLVIGGPGVGKTRWSSYFPKPIYLDCEGGLASVADRKVPYATIKTSQDMLEALTFLRQEGTRPEQDRQYRTVVVDTLDAFQRKVKDEWLQAHPQEQSFRGFEAWGYLDTKMQMLLTRLLNLDMNVIVAVHYTDKTITEGTGNDQVQRQELQLQLSGNVKDQVFNDFDLVGWMGTYYEPGANGRVEKRGLTFKASPDKPFLKDRLHVTPNWMEVKFSDEDYATLFAAVISRLDDLEPSQEVGEIPSLVGDGSPPAGVVGPLPGGPLPPVDPKDVPLEQHDKVTLQRMARAMGLEFKGNTLKGELVQLIADKQAELAANPPAEAESKSDSETSPVPPASDKPNMGETEAERREAAFNRLQEAGRKVADSASVEAAPAPAAPPAAATAVEAPADQVADQVAAPEPAPAEAPASTSAEAEPDPAIIVDDQGRTVNTQTGEIIESTLDEATTTVEAVLGGDVIEEREKVALAEPAKPAPKMSGQRVLAEKCEEPGCDNEPGPNPDFIKLGYIKWRKDYCDAHYLQHKNG